MGPSYFFDISLISALNLKKRQTVVTGDKLGLDFYLFSPIL